MNRILIAEDEARLAAFLEKGLKRNGYATVIAEDGHQAVELSQAENVHLLLLDLGLPVKDGWAVLKELRSQGENFPIIVVTALSDDRSRARALASGATDFVTKPFRFSDLLNKVRSYLPEQVAESL
jgi:two-component system, OmpR family, copper resistance phosphate regulon response regulator CusR